MGSYHELSLVMGTYPGLAIFKRFRAANVRNLLVLQAEIQNLTYQLGYTVQADRQSNDEVQRNLEKEVLRMMENEDNEELTKQWKKIKQLGSLLETYTLLQLQSVLRLPAANANNLATLRKWLAHPEGGNGFLQAYEGAVSDEDNDLTSLIAADENNDLISTSIDGPFISWFYQRIGYRFKNHSLPVWDPTLTEELTRTHLDFYPDSSAVVTTLSTVFASTLPTLSIFVL